MAMMNTKMTKMKPEKNPYRHADKALKKLYKLIEALFQRMASRAVWDELNVLQETKAIYDDVEAQAEREYLQIARKAYDDAGKEIVAVQPERKSRLSAPTVLFIAALLLAYNDKTQYVYRHELERKRARLNESLIAINDNPIIFNSNATREALRRGIHLFQRQVRNMSDTVTDEARRQAFDDTGVTKVRWITQQDEKVCPVCRDRNGVVYPLYDVPAKHPNCRCYLIPVEFKED